MKTSVREFGRRWSWATKEALVCLGMSLTNLRHNGLWWRSALLSLGITHVWLFLYSHNWALSMHLTGQAMLISFFGLLSTPSVIFHDSGGGMGGSIWNVFQVAQLALITLAIAAAMYVLLFIFAVHTTMSLSCRWLLLGRVHETVSQRYPLSDKRPLASERQTTRARLKHTVKRFLLLCVPVLSLLIVLRFLLTWNLRWLDHAIAGDTRLSSAYKRATLVLGVVLGLLMLVPVINLMLPALLCASVCHLRLRSAGETRPQPS